MTTEKSVLTPAYFQVGTHLDSSCLASPLLPGCHKPNPHSSLLLELVQLFPEQRNSRHPGRVQAQPKGRKEHSLVYDFSPVWARGRSRDQHPGRRKGEPVQCVTLGSSSLSSFVFSYVHFLHQFPFLSSLLLSFFSTYFYFTRVLFV